jgi:PAS domain S-box-containing protein
VPLPGDEGWGIMSVVLETTERKQAQSLLQRQAELLHLSYDAIIVWRLGGRIESWNKGAEELYGYSQEEAVDQVTHDLLKTIHPEPWPQIEAKLHERKFWEGELKHRTREGREVIVSARLQLVPDANAVERVLEINRDITESKRVEEALRASERLYRAIGESIDYGVWVCAPDGRNIYASESFLKLVGITQQECSDFGWGNVLHPEDAERTIAAWRECVRTGGIWDIEHRFLGVDGQWRSILARGVPVRDEAGEIVYWAGINLDISARKQMEEDIRKARDELELRVQERTAELNSYMTKLERSNQALQDFAYIAAHDMKEPLRKVISFGNLLSQKYKDSLAQTGNDYLNRMLHATERMQSLLTGLLDYSRVATAAEPFKEVDLSGLIREVISDLEVRIVRTGGEVHVGDLPVISADPTQMRQLFQNLIGNALKFHKPGEKPIVQVRCVSHTGSGSQIVVEDDGIGFDEQHLERIFAPFQRLHGRSEYEGTGMGLAICKKIVEWHGGSITAKSTPSKGSSFIITFPLTKSL